LRSRVEHVDRAHQAARSRRVGLIEQAALTFAAGTRSSKITPAFLYLKPGFQIGCRPAHTAFSSLPMSAAASRRTAFVL
jgi:hypothetical protein